MTALGTFSASAWAVEEVAALDDVAPSVADRTSSLRITRLTPTPVGRKVFLKLETNHGIVGWGEIDQLEMQTAAPLGM